MVKKLNYSQNFGRFLPAKIVFSSDRKTVNISTMYESLRVPSSPELKNAVSRTKSLNVEAA